MSDVKRLISAFAYRSGRGSHSIYKRRGERGKIIIIVTIFLLLTHTHTHTHTRTHAHTETQQLNRMKRVKWTEEEEEISTCGTSGTFGAKDRVVKDRQFRRRFLLHRWNKWINGNKSKQSKMSQFQTELRQNCTTNSVGRWRHQPKTNKHSKLITNNYSQFR